MSRRAERRRRRWAASVAIACALASGSVAADVDTALAMLRAGEVAAARAELRRLALDGDLRAREALATLIARGIGGPRDLRGAMGWYCRIAHDPAGGHAVERALWYLAEYFRTGGAVPDLGYLEGRREDENPIRAYFWYSLLAGQRRFHAKADADAERLGRIGMSTVGRELYPEERAAVADAVARWKPGPPGADCLEQPRLH